MARSADVLVHEAMYLLRVEKVACQLTARAQILRRDVIAAEAGLFRDVLEPEDLLSRMQK